MSGAKTSRGTLRNLHFGYSNRVHDEGVAEAFAWLLLNELYPKYPEVEFFHIAKLRLFLAKRPDDPHLLGAAGLSSLFHFRGSRNFPDLFEFAKSLDLEDFLNHREMTGLSKGQSLGVFKVKIEVP